MFGLYMIDLGQLKVGTEVMLTVDIGSYNLMLVTKGVMRFGRQSKLSPQCVGPFEILRRVVPVAYELALPPTYSANHLVFYVSMLRQYVPDESYVLQYDMIE